MAALTLSDTDLFRLSLEREYARHAKKDVRDEIGNHFELFKKKVNHVSRLLSGVKNKNIEKKKNKVVALDKQDLIETTCAFLDVKELALVGRVNQMWYTCSMAPHLWKHLVCTDIEFLRKSLAVNIQSKYLDPHWTKIAKTYYSLDNLKSRITEVDIQQKYADAKVYCALGFCSFSLFVCLLPSPISIDRLPENDYPIPDFPTD